MSGSSEHTFEPVNPTAPTRVLAVPSGGEVQAARRVRPAAAPQEISLLGEGGPAETQSAKPARPLRLILNYKATIALVAAVIAAPAITGIWLANKPLYSANGQIRIKPIIPTLVFRTEENGMIPYYPNFLATQVAVMLSPTVLQRVLAQEDVQTTEWYKQDRGSSWLGGKSRIEELQELLTIRPRPRTEIIDVNIDLPLPRDSAVIVNAVLDQYIRHSHELIEGSQDRLFRQLVEQHDTLKTRVREKEESIQELKRQLQTSEPEAMASAKRGALERAEERQATLQRQQAMAEWRLEQARKREGAAMENAKSAGAGIAANSAALAFGDDVQWQRLRDSYRQAEYEYSMGRQRFGEGHPRLRMLEERRNRAGALLESRQSELAARVRVVDGPGPASTMPSNSQDVRIATEAVELVTRELEMAVKDVQERRVQWEQAVDRSQVLARHQQELKEQQDLFNLVRGRLEAKRMERSVPGSIDILARATEPTSVSKDRRPVFSLLALAAAMAAGLLAAYYRTGRDLPVAHEEAILMSTTAAPFLGRLPRVKTARDRELPLDDPMLQEGVRMMRTVLLRRIEQGQGNVVLITSSVPREGKTTVSIMLAQSLAMCGKSVLLVDADHYNPTICVALGLKPGIGIRQALAEGRHDAEVVIPGGMPRLTVMPGDETQNHNGHEILANGTFSAAIRRWSGQYDVVLMDTPPVLSAADAMMLSRHADGTLFMIREERTRREDMREAMSHLASVGAQLWGTVLIGPKRVRRSGHYPESRVSTRTS